MHSLFFGGVHPADRKELSGRNTPAPAPIPAQVAIPLCQHIGAPCTPLVKPGDTVKMGQKIGDGDNLCVPVHASVSGTVLAIEPRPNPAGGTVLCVVIENDFQDTPAQTLEPHLDPSGLTAEEIVTIIREAGIVGMGGATFPTDVKAWSAMGKVDTLIANACECEPYITADDALLCTYPEQVIRGMRLLMSVLNPQKAVIAVEDNKAEAIQILKAQLAKEPGIELRVLPTRYPQGAEKQLIQAVTGRQVPPGGLPYQVGCAVFNAATYASVYKAVYEGEPVTRRIVTLTGEAVKKPQNFIVRIGTSFAEVIEAGGGLTPDTWKVIAGGPMMGVAQETLAAPIVKGTNAILCLSTAQNREEENPICIRCGKCITACPMNLQPLYLYRYELAGDLDALRKLNLNDCIQCGCCSYVCPGRLPLVERFRIGKKTLKEASAT